jgi:hypothetical protein
MNETKISIAAYVSLLQRQESVMVELLSQDFEDKWRYPEIKNPVAATWLRYFFQSHIEPVGLRLSIIYVLY